MDELGAHGPTLQAGCSSAGLPPWDEVHVFSVAWPSRSLGEPVHHFTPDRYLGSCTRSSHATTSYSRRWPPPAPASTWRGWSSAPGRGRRRGACSPRYPARLVGIDESPPMLEQARADLPADRVEELRVARLQDPLPEGPFELVFSALAVHHLDGAGSATCSSACAQCSHPGAASSSATSSSLTTRPTSSHRSRRASTFRTPRPTSSSGCAPRASSRASRGSWKDCAVIAADAI